jgi:hypothetical protein
MGNPCWVTMMNLEQLKRPLIRVVDCRRRVESPGGEEVATNHLACAHSQAMRIWLMAARWCHICTRQHNIIERIMGRDRLRMQEGDGRNSPWAIPSG